MPYPTTFPAGIADDGVVDRRGHRAPRLTGPRELARRLAEADERYIRTEFVPLEDLLTHRGTAAASLREALAEGRLPQPAYRLDDGSDWVPEDYLGLMDEAGGLQQLPAHFQARYRSAASRLGLAVDAATVDEQWEDYLSGGYFVCLRHADPESIAAKARVITDLDALLDAPEPAEPAWRDRLRAAVDELGGIERSGALLDPARWGGPMSPQWYGTYLRTQYPAAFGGAGAYQDHER